MNRNQRVAGMCLLIVGMLILTGCGEKFVPAFAPQVGDKRVVNIQMNAATSMDMMGQSISTNQGSTQRFSLEVTDVGVDGVVSINGIIEEMTMEMDDMVSTTLPMITGGKLDAQGLSDLVGKVAGKEFTLQVAPDGEVLSNTGLYGLPREVISDAKLNLGQAKPMIEGMLEQMLGEASLQNSIGSIFDYASNEPVAVGKSWVKQQSVNQQIDIDAENTITLLSNENGKANFQMDVVFSGDGSSSSGMPGMDIDVQMKMDGSGQGTAVVDTVAGWPEMVKQDSDMTITISADSIPGMNQDMEQKMKIKYSAKIDPQ